MAERCGGSGLIAGRYGESGHIARRSDGSGLIDYKITRKAYYVIYIEVLPGYSDSLLCNFSYNKNFHEGGIIRDC